MGIIERGQDRIREAVRVGATMQAEKLREEVNVTDSCVIVSINDKLFTQTMGDTAQAAPATPAPSAAPVRCGEPRGHRFAYIIAHIVVVSDRFHGRRTTAELAIMLLYRCRSRAIKRPALTHPPTYSLMCLLDTADGDDCGCVVSDIPCSRPQLPLG